METDFSSEAAARSSVAAKELNLLHFAAYPDQMSGAAKMQIRQGRRKPVQSRLAVARSGYHNRVQR